MQRFKLFGSIARLGFGTSVPDMRAQQTPTVLRPRAIADDPEIVATEIECLRGEAEQMRRELQECEDECEALRQSAARCEAAEHEAELLRVDIALIAGTNRRAERIARCEEALARSKVGV